MKSVHKVILCILVVGLISTIVIINEKHRKTKKALRNQEELTTKISVANEQLKRNLNISDKKILELFQNLPACKSDRDHRISKVFDSQETPSLENLLEDNVFATATIPTTDLFSKTTGKQGLSIGFYRLLSLHKNGQSICVKERDLFAGVKSAAKANRFYQFESAFGGEGQELGRLALPYGSEISIKGGQERLYVTDCSRNNFNIFSLEGDILEVFGKHGEGKDKFHTPADIKIYDDKIFIIQERSHKIQVFSTAGRFLRSWGSNKGKGSKEQGFFDHPLGVSISPDGLVYVTDQGNNRVQVFDQKGNFKFTFGTKGSGPGEMLGPYYSKFHPNGNLYLVDRGNHRIQVFDKTGKFLFKWGANNGDGTKGSRPGELDWPHEIEIDNDGRIYIADTFNNRIQIFDENGLLITIIDEGLFFWPKTVAVSSKGTLFIGMVGDSRVITKWKRTAQLPLKGKNFELSTIASQTPVLQESMANGSSIYSKHCVRCHRDGEFGAPRTSRSTDWTYRSTNKVDLVSNVLLGKGSMPPKGGCTECSREELLEAVLYMLNHQKN